MEDRTDRVHNHRHAPKNPSRFMDGLLVGLILGFGLALLITTKKGRKMLKTLTDEGLDSVTELKKRLDNIEVTLDEDDETDEEYIVEEVEEEPDSPQAAPSVKPLGNEEAKKTSKKRLFKGISRKN